MSEDSPRLARAVAAIDAANALDPHTIHVEGKCEPAELVYGRRMSTTLGRISPEASEHLRIAVRGQHIERWTSPRKAYVESRVGYLKWRKDLQDFHARRLGEIMLRPLLRQRFELRERGIGRAPLDQDRDRHAGVSVERRSTRPFCRRQRSDNGAEMTAKIVRGWFAKLGATTLYVEPGSP